MTKLQHEAPPKDRWKDIYNDKQNQIDGRQKRRTKQKAMLVRAFANHAVIPDADKEVLLNMAFFYAKGLNPTPEHKAVARNYRAKGLDLRSNHQSAMNKLRELLPGMRRKRKKKEKGGKKFIRAILPGEREA